MTSSLAYPKLFGVGDYLELHFSFMSRCCHFAPLFQQLPMVCNNNINNRIFVNKSLFLTECGFNKFKKYGMVCAKGVGIHKTMPPCTEPSTKSLMQQTVQANDHELYVLCVTKALQCNKQP